MAHQRQKSRSITPHGLTPTEAVKIVRKALPQVEHWMLWVMEPDPAEFAMRGMLGDGIKTNGQIGTWQWQRVPCDVQEVHTWGGSIATGKSGYCWLGLVQVQGAKGENFHIFSYQRPTLELNAEYLVSTGDLKMLRRFSKDVRRHYRPRRSSRKVTVDVHGGMDMQLDLRTNERPYLPESMIADIEQQTDHFFRSAAMYKRMDIPYRRGLLFTGAPGTGKTMVIRHLIRQTYRSHKTQTHYLNVNRKTDDDDIQLFFGNAQQNLRPTLLIIEEIDSLFNECHVSRSNLLAKLDGISPLNGVMLIATTNNPERVDTALLHRPSRFDRVWSFPLPDQALRLNYMKDTFGLEGEEPLLERLAKATDGWTFAYIKELRVTASFAALSAGHQSLTPDSLKQAFELLDKQFKSAQKNHVCQRAQSSSVGFGSQSHDLAAELATLKPGIMCRP